MLMSLMPTLLDIVLQLIGIFVRNKQKQMEYQKAVTEAVKQYQKGVLDSAKSREVDADLGKKLEDAWQKKWGNPTPPADVPPVGGKPTDAPPTTDTYHWPVPTGPFVSNVKFVMPFGDLPVGSAVYAEQKWILCWVTKGATSVELGLNRAGRREIRARLPDGSWTSPRYIDIKDA